MSNTNELIQARYDDLCKQRDKINAEVAPIQVKLNAANEKVNKAQADANALAERIQEIRGGANWIASKKEIGVLATVLTAAKNGKPIA